MIRFDSAEARNDLHDWLLRLRLRLRFPFFWQLGTAWRLVGDGLFFDGSRDCGLRDDEAWRKGNQKEYCIAIETPDMKKTMADKVY